MEKTIQLDQRENGMLQQMEQERTNALAAVGALSLDMESARKNLETVAERQRSFIRHMLVSRNIDKYDNARLQNGSLIVTLPDQIEAQALGSVRLPNGIVNPDQIIKE